MRNILAILAVQLLITSGLSVAENSDRFVANSVTEITGHAVTGNPISVWSGGALVTAEYAQSTQPRIKCFDRIGREICRHDLWIPGVNHMNVLDGGFARGWDGTIAVVGTAYGQDGHGAGFLAVLSPEGANQTVVRTAPYAPRRVTVAADGSIWTVGREVVNGRASARDFHLVHRYARSGDLLGSYLPRTGLVNGRGYPSAVDYSHLAASRDGRIGWLSEPARRYIEFDSEGNLRRVVNADALYVEPSPAARQAIVGFALCEGGNLFASAHSKAPEGPNAWGIYALEGNRWNFRPQPGRWGMLYGCDGSDLAATMAGATGSHKSITWLSFVRRE